jgi:hypothetical protein
MLSMDSNLCPLSGSLIPENIIRQQFSIIYTTDCGSKWNCVVVGHASLSECPDSFLQLPSMAMDATQYHSALFWHCSSGSYECIHNSAAVKMAERNPSPSLLHHCKFAVANSTHVAHWFSLSMCGIHFPRTIHFPSCSVRKQTHLMQIFPLLLQLLCT